MWGWIVGWGGWGGGGIWSWRRIWRRVGGAFGRRGGRGGGSGDGWMRWGGRRGDSWCGGWSDSRFVLRFRAGSEGTCHAFSKLCLPITDPSSPSWSFLIVHASTRAPIAHHSPPSYNKHILSSLRPRNLIAQNRIIAIHHQQPKPPPLPLLPPGHPRARPRKRPLHPLHRPDRHAHQRLHRPHPLVLFILKRQNGLNLQSRLPLRFPSRHGQDAHAPRLVAYEDDAQFGDLGHHVEAFEVLELGEW